MRSRSIRLHWRTEILHRRLFAGRVTKMALETFMRVEGGKVTLKIKYAPQLLPNRLFLSSARCDSKSQRRWDAARSERRGCPGEDPAYTTNRTQIALSSYCAIALMLLAIPCCPKASMEINYGLDTHFLRGSFNRRAPKRKFSRILPEVAESALVYSNFIIVRSSAFECFSQLQPSLHGLCLSQSGMYTEQRQIFCEI